jgi:hypothetical protein
MPGETGAVPAVLPAGEKTATQIARFREALHLKCRIMHRKIALTILLAACAGSLFAQNRALDFQVTKISRDLISTPEFSYNGAQPYRPNSRDRWLEVEVVFSSALEFTDELTLKYFILMSGKLFTGEVTHVNILGGKELRSVIYISPRALTHIMGTRPVVANAVENVAVQIVQGGTVKTSRASCAPGRNGTAAFPRSPVSP